MSWISTQYPLNQQNCTILHLWCVVEKQGKQYWFDIILLVNTTEMCIKLTIMMMNSWKDYSAYPVYLKYIYIYIKIVLFIKEYTHHRHSSLYIYIYIYYLHMCQQCICDKKVTRNEIPLCLVLYSSPVGLLHPYISHCLLNLLSLFFVFFCCFFKL